MPKKNIAIITQSLGCNYGGLLQNYALQQVLLRNGFSSETIDHSSLFYLDVKDFIWRIRMRLSHLVFPKKFPYPSYKPSRKEIGKYSYYTKLFTDKYIVHTRPCRSHLGFWFNSIYKKYGTYIVGSDQIWRPFYNRSFQKEMFLSFVKGKNDIGRIAYAASFGSDVWEFTKRQTDKYTKLLGMFDLITVREKSAVQMCEEHFHVKSEQVLDPTMLLEQNEYIELIEKEREPKSKGSLFHYILDPNQDTDRFIYYVASRTGYSPFGILPKHPIGRRSKNDIKNDIEGCTYPNVTSWLRAFYDAEMVIVDSFHGAVFSIIFNKPFWAICNSTRGNPRFSSLLSMVGLENRMLSYDDILHPEILDLFPPINWNKINGIISKEKEKSEELLLTALHT